MNFIHNFSYHVSFFKYDIFQLFDSFEIQIVIMKLVFNKKNFLFID